MAGGFKKPGVSRDSGPEAALRRSAHIGVVEPGPTGGPGAMGAQILISALRRAGHTATHVRIVGSRETAQMSLFEGETMRDREWRGDPPDAWFISTIYVRQWVWLRDLFARLSIEPYSAERPSGSPLVVFGGQTSFAPAPIADFADIVALGDGELTGVELASRLSEGMSRAEVMAWAHARDGRGYWVPTLSPMKMSRWETPVHRPLMVYPGNNEGRHPTIEVARGCRSKCSFCPIGWAGGKYREAPSDDVRAMVRDLDMRGKHSANLFAPDYSSVSYVSDLDRFLDEAGCRNRGVDARIDRALSHLRSGGTVKSFSFGLEGPSARLRAAIGKPVAVELVSDVMRRLQGLRVKWYIILGLPGEEDSDIDELEQLVDHVRHDHMLDVTLTMLQPVPHTPLGRVCGRYNVESAQRGERLREFGRQMHRLGRKVSFSQPKGRDLHEHDTVLQRGGRSMARYLARAQLAWSRSEKWREQMARDSIDVDELLAPIAPDASTPWDGVDVGIDPKLVARGMDIYWRRFRGEEDVR